LNRPIVSVHFEFRFFNRPILFLGLKFRFLYRPIVSVRFEFRFLNRPILFFGVKFRFLYRAIVSASFNFSTYFKGFYNYSYSNTKMTVFSFARLECLKGFLIVTGRAGKRR
jgi:hypothetical protein